MNDPFKPKVRYRRHDVVRLPKRQGGALPPRRLVLTLGSKTLSRNIEDRTKERNYHGSARPS